MASFIRFWHTVELLFKLGETLPRLVCICVTVFSFVQHVAARDETHRCPRQLLFLAYNTIPAVMTLSQLCLLIIVLLTETASITLNHHSRLLLTGDSV
jgi:hypothetical protein